MYKNTPVENTGFLYDIQLLEISSTAGAINKSMWKVGRADGPNDGWGIIIYEGKMDIILPW